MQNRYHSEVVVQHKTLPARVMRISTSHGDVLTPTFMPVGTKAMVNYLSPHDLLQNGSQLILGGNTYHMLCAPGMDTIQALGGMHKMMGWHQSMLTDSGGFQVFSLAKRGNICIIDEEGAHFKHPFTGKILHLTPATSINAQKIIGADIIMAFDECTPEIGGREAALAALTRTHRWLLLAKEMVLRDPNSAYGYKQALFGIIQGGSFRDLREESAKFVVDLDLDGIGIGGEVIGFDMEKTIEILEWIRPLLPSNKIRYSMGVGLNPEDLIAVVKAGVDIFDCVGPTRNARHGTLYCGEIIERDGWIAFVNHEESNARILIKKSQYAKDDQPIMPGCTCYTCANFSRGYLHFLFKEKLVAYVHLASIHNIHVMQSVCTKMRNLMLAALT